MTARRASCLALLVALAAAPSRAEVSVDRGTGGIIRAYFEPGARGPWQRIREDVPATDVLNEHGDLSGNGWPVILDNAGTGLPDAVWTTGGADSDILLSHHDGTGWTPPLRLSELRGDDRLPAFDADAEGNRFVAWDRSPNGHHAMQFTAVAGDDSGRTRVVELSSRPRQGRLASVLVGPDGGVYVAYEEATSVNDARLTVAVDRVDVPRRSDGVVLCGGEVPIDVARVATFTTRLPVGDSSIANVQLLRDGGSIRVTWTDSDTQMGSSLLVDGAFAPPEYTP